jgi:hypothetical protein
MLLNYAQSNSLKAESQYADIGDTRLDDRLGELLVQVAQSPGEHFPQAARTEADLEAIYRFFRNDKAGFEPVSEPHFEATAKRVDAYDDQPILAVHDTTDILVSKDRYIAGMGRASSNSSCGFLGHFCLAVQSTGPRHPVGVLGGLLWRRGLPSRMDTEAFEDAKDCLETLDNESDKWDRVIEAVEGRVERPENLVHVVDAGADKYARIAAMKARKSRFVARIQQNRRVTDQLEGVDSPKIFDCLEKAPRVSERTISLSARDNADRPPSARKIHPSRDARQAKVEIRATTARLRRPAKASSELAESVEVGLIWIREADVPEGEDPIDWKLMCDAPVEDPKQVLKVVDWYRRRWVIEEYFGALKGGCNAEDRLLRSAQTYTTALAVLLPAAWRLLLLRSLVQNAPKTPAQQVLRESQLQALASFDRTAFDKVDGLTVAQAFDAIAQLGGHLSYNGPPGWIVLMRGWHLMTPAEIANRKAREQMLRQVRQQWQESSPEQFEQWLEEQAQTCDQS